MSIVTTCSLCGVNPLEYLLEHLTVVQKHSAELFKDPRKWMPWNYQQALHPPPC